MKNPIELLTRSPLWAIRPEAIHAAIIGLIQTSECLNAIPVGKTFSLSWEAARPSMRGTGQNKTAVVPIQGVLTKDGPSWYGSNYDSIGQAVEDAAANTEVKRILLSVDSPGGEVLGAPETAAIIANAAKLKPVSAIVDGMAASAAYWLASQARDITVTPSGEVGSVGVRMMHVDISKALDNSGIAVTELSSGDFKTEWSPYKPLAQEAIDNMMPRLNSTHQEFLNAIADGRGERAAQMRQLRFGEGRMFSASDAMGHGLADKVQSSREFYKAIIPAQESEPSAPSFPRSKAARYRLDIARERSKV